MIIKDCGVLNGSEVSAFCSFYAHNAVSMAEFLLLCWHYALYMLLYTHYAKNYAGIIDAGLPEKLTEINW